MALKSKRITKKELDNYYGPKNSQYNFMVSSISSPMEYGQVIQHVSQDGVVNQTYYNIYSLRGLNSNIVYDPLTNIEVSEQEAGPTFWNVSEQDGLDFLNGSKSIVGYIKLKYCKDCVDGNGLDEPIINNFSKRFTKVSELVYSNNLLEGFLFYDLDLPRFKNVFPSIKKDDGVNITYQFKDVNTGADLDVDQVSTITSKPVLAIEVSVNTAPVVRPKEGVNTVITSCCNESISFIIPGQYTIGNILYTDGIFDDVGTQNLYCWYVESLTNVDSNILNTVIFTSGGRSCEACVKINPCPIYCEIESFRYSIREDLVCDSLYTEYPIDFSGKLYEPNGCGITLAPTGYYTSMKDIIYYWNQETGVFKENGKCRTTTYYIEYCCTGEQRVFDFGGKTPKTGSIVYLSVSGDEKYNYMVPCWSVGENSSDKEADIEGYVTGALYIDCIDCYTQNQMTCP